jgi:D-beta-D-heptose 7-phosphate kinase/D-beta-D-heptose 1-phosphate adenosyltransferase
MLRVDEETLPKEDIATKHILDILNKNNYDAIIISDYNKGVITPNLMKGVKDYASKHNTPIFADIKPIHKKLFKNVFLIKPNLKEAKEMCSDGISDINTIGIKLSKEMNCNVLITLGEKGMALFEQNKKPVFIETSAKEVFDVSGAGDTVIASFTLTTLSGAGLQEATRVANIAGGIVVGKAGTAVVTKEELTRITEVAW